MPATATKQANVVETIDNMLRRIDANRIKTAGAKSEPGGYQGSTTHPVKDIDDRLIEATEGSRSSENTEDVKESIGDFSVDSSKERPGGEQESVQTNIGMTSKETGHDPESETSSVKPGKDDPGSSHPARTDNDSLDGHKYASTAAKLQAYCKKAADMGNDLVAAIAVEANSSTKTAQGSRGAPAANPPKPAGVEKTSTAGAPRTPADVNQAAAAGYELAEQAGQPAIDKQAADQLVVDSLAETIWVSRRMADKAADYFDRYKTASECEEHPEEEGEGEGEGGEVPPEGSGGAPGGGGDEEAVLQALSGGDAMSSMGGAPGGDPSAMGGAPGGDPMAAMGAPPPGDPAAMGGDPMAAMGGDPSAMGGGMPGMGGGMPPPGMGGDPSAMGGAPGGGGNEQQMLMSVLQELGISPQELEAAAAAKQAEAIRLAPRPQTGGFKPKTAVEVRKYAYLRNYILDVTGRQ